MALGIEYDGSDFRGWQMQGPGVRTVQGCLERALAKVAGHPVKTVCAGRTDVGVHGSGQVIHFDSDAYRSPRAWILGGNANLPLDISVSWAQPVADTFHARFSALARRYRYVILNRPYRSALHRRRAAWWHRPLALEPMREAAGHFVGEHDFSSLRAAECQAASPVRTIYELSVARYGDYIVVDIEANAFLHRMVRNIIGVLLAVGGGDHPSRWAQTVLAARDRRQAGVTAPAEGLCLMAVRYPDVYPLPRPDGAESVVGP